MTVIIGMDPHKRSATIEALDSTGKVVATGRYSTDNVGYAEMLTAAQRSGTTTDSSATGSNPHTDPSDKPHPGPVLQANPAPAPTS
ncbi:hypothetical protein ACFROC_01525 [Nocardia tengchongensis]|uniref:hypothetical protein n=1 Tax=Nocardia tengchongensis TaxID=2055889 RepID=UPI0036BD5EF4